jgi:beta-lactamase superfamily II metal-dependent hydrolase
MKFLLPLLLAAALPAQAQSLTATFIDVEGGQATLFVTPTHQSLLIDTGWAGNNFRDADRIAAAAHAAGLTKIDYVLITHYHDDHVGGVPQLVARIPVGTFIDHGPNREIKNQGVVNNYSEFQNVLATNPVKEIIAKPGDRLPITGITATVVSADGNVLAKPLVTPAQPNPYCTESQTTHPPLDDSENSRSLGVVITFGKLRILDLGDLTWDKELALMCPANKLGPIDILIVSHHGFNQSSSPALVHAIHPRIAIMDNGAKKGGSTSTLQVVSKSPGLETLWQLHYSEEGGPTNNTADKFIANPQGQDSAKTLILKAFQNGTFDVTNTRTQYKQTYAAKP